MGDQRARTDKSPEHPLNLLALLVSVVALAALTVLVSLALLNGDVLVGPDFKGYSANAGAESAAPLRLPDGTLIGSAGDASDFFELRDGGEVQMQPTAEAPLPFATADDALISICSNSDLYCPGDNPTAVTFELCEVHDLERGPQDLVFAPRPCRSPLGANPLKLVLRDDGLLGDSALIWGQIPPDDDPKIVDGLAEIDGERTSEPLLDELVERSQEIDRWTRGTAVRHVSDPQGIYLPGLEYQTISSELWELVALGALALVAYWSSVTPVRRQRRWAVVLFKTAWPFRAGNAPVAAAVLVSVGVYPFSPHEAGIEFYAATAQVIALLILTLGLERRSFALGGVWTDLGPSDPALEGLELLEFLSDEGLIWRPVLALTAIGMLVAGLFVALVALAAEEPSGANAGIVFSAVAGGVAAIAILAIRSPRSP